ncbi:MAG: transglycosylase SLT domain-containing protein [Deltaproteobacteria bacterium]|nr:transglycosylase SLT domain-containing protein [Deltaproteobacteria bacterium]
MRKLFLTVPLVIALISYSSTYSSANFLSKNTYPYLNYSNEIIFKKAYDNYLRGRYKSAAGQFRFYALKGKLLKNYALYYQGLSLFKLKEYRKADYVFLKLASLYPKFVFYKNAVFYLAVSEEKNGYYSSEVSHLRYIIKHSKKSAVRSYAMFKIYKAYTKLKNRRLAERYLLRVYIDYPNFSKIHNISFKDAALNKSEKMRRGLDLYYDAYYSGSLALLKNIPGKSKKARFIILKDLMKLKSPLFLKKADERLNKYYGVRKLSLLNLKVRYYYYILHNPKETMPLIAYIADKYGFLPQNTMRIYREIVWNGVLKDLKSGKPASAANSLKSFLSVNDKVNADNAKFLFWYGVVLEKLGYKSRASFYFNIIKASRILRYSYYGIMSEIMINKIDGVIGMNAKKLNVGYIENSSGRSGMADYSGYSSVFKKELAADPSLDLTFKRLKVFLNLKLFSLSNIEIERFYTLMRNKKNAVFFAYMLYKNGYYAAAINLASNLIYNYRYKSLLLNGRFLKILYPRPYYSYVGKYSSRYGIPVNLIYGVMRQESRYNPVCYSSANAIGLMQIIPSTGYYIARQTGCYNFNPSMLYRKNINISFGSYYLKTLLNQFNYRKYLAIASYNAGPGAVAYWRNSLMKNYEMPLFIELIPFNQTRNYVKKVLANYYVYNSLYKY